MASPFAAQTIKITEDDLNLKGAPHTIGQDQVGNALMVVYFIAGIVAVLMIIIGGIRYVTSNGDSSQIQAAKNQILYAIVGLVIVIAAAGITAFVVQRVA
jgi:hypothetical protein